jgi:hypothetical protein
VQRDSDSELVHRAEADGSRSYVTIQVIQTGVSSKLVSRYVINVHCANPRLAVVPAKSNEGTQSRCFPSLT